MISPSGLKTSGRKKFCFWWMPASRARCWLLSGVLKTARRSRSCPRSAGVHVVAASTKDQYAAEVKDLGHGVFTYTLLEGLNGKAARPGDAVTVRKLMGYVEEQLPEITKKYKQEAQYPVVDSRGMDFPLVTQVIVR